MGQNGCSRCEQGENDAPGELFGRKASYAMRGIAILMVMASHYGDWYAAWIGIPALTQFLMGLGRYGVDIFFLMSGYAMAKNTAGERPGAAFWLKRLRGTYLPYLILAGIIEIAAGGAFSPARLIRYLLAQDYWFIFDIMVLYLAFFLSFQCKRLRIAVLLLFTVIFSAWLYGMGRQDFWYVSNLAFPLGAACGLYEKRLLAWMKEIRPWPELACTLFCVVLVPAAMRERAMLLQTGGKGRLQMMANTLFSLWAALLPWFGKTGASAVCRRAFAGLPGRTAGGILRFFGKNSLYLYLLHAFLYYQIASRANLGTVGGFAAAFGSAVLCAWMFSLIWGAVTANMSAVGKKGGKK